MKMLIDVPEDIVSHIQSQWSAVKSDDSPVSIVCKAVCQGEVLPDVDGKLLLVSENKIIDGYTELSFSNLNWINEVNLSNAVVKVIQMGGSNAK